MKKVSIITICLNCEDAIVKTIKSVKEQTFMDKEFIVIDGGSTDGTLKVIESESANIDFFLSEPDHGIYDAINKGVVHANGEWIICMNAGDIFANENVLRNVFAECIPNGKSAIYSDYWARTPEGYLNLCHMNRKAGKVMHQAFIYKKNLHDRYGLYLVTKPYICSDLQFMLMIPEQEFYKTSTIISITDYGGVSQDNVWCDECSLGLKVAFRMKSMNRAFLEYLWAVLKKKTPYRLRFFMKKYILRQMYCKATK